MIEQKLITIEPESQIFIRYQRIKKLLHRVFFKNSDQHESPPDTELPVTEEVLITETQLTPEQSEKIESIAQTILMSKNYNLLKHREYARELAVLAVTRRLPGHDLIGTPQDWQQNYQDRISQLEEVALRDSGINLDTLLDEKPINEQVGGFSEELAKFKRLPVFKGMYLNDAVKVLESNSPIKSIGALIEETTDLNNLPRAKTYLTDVGSARANIAFGTFDISLAGRYGEVIFEFPQQQMPDTALVSFIDFNEILGDLKAAYFKSIDLDIDKIDVNKTYENEDINRLILKAKQLYLRSFVTIDDFGKYFALFRRLSALSNKYPDPYMCERGLNPFKGNEVMIPYQFPHPPSGITSLNYTEADRPRLQALLGTALPMTLAPAHSNGSERDFYINKQLVEGVR